MKIVFFSVATLLIAWGIFQQLWEMFKVKWRCSATTTGVADFGDMTDMYGKGWSHTVYYHVIVNGQQYLVRPRTQMEGSEAVPGMRVLIHYDPNDVGFIYQPGYFKTASFVLILWLVIGSVFAWVACAITFFEYFMQIISTGISLASVTIGTVLLISTGMKKKKCSAVTIGEVVGTDTQMKFNAGRDYVHKAERPRFQVTINGYTFILDTNVYSSESPFNVGDSVEIHYNPDSPNQFWYEGYFKIVYIVSGLFIGIGAFLFIAFLPFYIFM